MNEIPEHAKSRISLIRTTVGSRQKEYLMRCKGNEELSNSLLWIPEEILAESTGGHWDHKLTKENGTQVRLTQGSFSHSSVVRRSRISELLDVNGKVQKEYCFGLLGSETLWVPEELISEWRDTQKTSMPKISTNTDGISSGSSAQSLELPVASRNDLECPSEKPVENVFEPCTTSTEKPVEADGDLKNAVTDAEISNVTNSTDVNRTEEISIPVPRLDFVTVTPSETSAVVSLATLTPSTSESEETAIYRRKSGLGRGRRPTAILGFHVDISKSAATNGIHLLVVYDDGKFPEREAITLPECLAECRDLTLHFLRQCSLGSELELLLKLKSSSCC